jgi:hypothetical protein
MLEPVAVAVALVVMSSTAVSADVLIGLWTFDASCAAPEPRATAHGRSNHCLTIDGFGGQGSVIVDCQGNTTASKWNLTLFPTDANCVAPSPGNDCSGVGAKCTEYHDDNRPIFAVKVDCSGKGLSRAIPRNMDHSPQTGT